MIQRGFYLALLNIFFLNAIQTNVMSRLVLLALVRLLGHLLGSTRRHPGPAALSSSSRHPQLLFMSLLCRALLTVFMVPVLLSLLTRKCIYLPEDEASGLAVREVAYQGARPDEGGRQQ